MGDAADRERDNDIADVEIVDEPGTDLEPVRADVAVLSNTALMRPVGSTAQIVEAFEEYQSLRTRLITASDVQDIQGKQFVKKSGWRKIATAFGINVEYRDENLTTDADGNVTNCRVHARAIAPNGRYFDAVGVCDRYERCCRERLGEKQCRIGSKKHYHCVVGCDGVNHFSKPQHDIPATAATRAANRAIADLVGFGEVSAEEMDREAGEPLTTAQSDALVAALNRIADENQRKGAKIAFVSNFGKPNELTTDRLENARTWIERAGGSFASDANPTGDDANKADAEVVAPQQRPPSASAAIPPTDETTSTRDRADYGQNVSPSADQPSADRDGDDGGQGVSTDPAPEPVAEQASVEGGGSGDVAPAFDGPPAEKNQKTQIAIRCNELGIDASDKQMIVGVLTRGRTTTTTEISKKEAASMLAFLRHVQGKSLGISNEIVDGVVRRGIVATNPVGEKWLEPYADAEISS